MFLRTIAAESKRKRAANERCCASIFHTCHLCSLRTIAAQSKRSMLRMNDVVHSSSIPVIYVLYVPLRLNPSGSVLRMNDVVHSSSIPVIYVLTYHCGEIQAKACCDELCRAFIFHTCHLCSYVPLRRNPSESMLRVNDVVHPSSIPISEKRNL